MKLEGKPSLSMFVAIHLTRASTNFCSSWGMATVSFLGQEAATQLDVDLMSVTGGFSLEQLMELAGLSVACAVTKEYPAETFQRVLILCGPGNNGGDGLVAARHLCQFGYKPTVVYPKESALVAKNAHYGRLVVQLRQARIPLCEDINDFGEFDLIIDSIFGFSFKGFRGEGKDAPYDAYIRQFQDSKIPIVAVDIPSGWDVEKGPPAGIEWQPDMLVSLTAPKLCAQFLRGRHHYVGGRFVPPSIVEKYHLVLPCYPGVEQCVRCGV